MLCRSWRERVSLTGESRLTYTACTLFLCQEPASESFSRTLRKPWCFWTNLSYMRAFFPRGTDRLTTSFFSSSWQIWFAAAYITGMSLWFQLKLKNFSVAFLLPGYCQWGVNERSGRIQAWLVWQFIIINRRIH